MDHPMRTHPRGFDRSKNLASPDAQLSLAVRNRRRLCSLEKMALVDRSDRISPTAFPGRFPIKSAIFVAASPLPDLWLGHAHTPPQRLLLDLLKMIHQKCVVGVYSTRIHYEIGVASFPRIARRIKVANIENARLS